MSCIRSGSKSVRTDRSESENSPAPVSVQHMDWAYGSTTHAIFLYKTSIQCNAIEGKPSMLFVIEACGTSNLSCHILKNTMPKGHKINLKCNKENLWTCLKLVWFLVFGFFLCILEIFSPFLIATVCIASNNFLQYLSIFSTLLECKFFCQFDFTFTSQIATFSLTHFTRCILKM